MKDGRGLEQAATGSKLRKEPAGVRSQRRGMLPRRWGAVTATVALSTLVGSVAMGGVAGAASAHHRAHKHHHASKAHGVPVSKYRHQIHRELGKPTFHAPGPSLDAKDVKTVKGKTVMVVLTSEFAPILVNTLKGIQQAGKTVGLNVESYNGNDSVTTQEKGIKEAISQKVAAIITIGIESSTVSGTLGEAKKAGIPVIALLGQEPKVGVPGQGGGPDAFGVVSLDYPVAAQLTTKDAVIATKGKVKAAVLGFPDNAISSSEEHNAKKVLSACKGCKVLKTETIPIAKWSTTVTSETEALVREFPSMNSIIVAADGEALFAADGVNAAKASGRVHIYTMDGTPGAALKAVAGGNVITADPGGEAQWLGWQGVDDTLRALLGQKPEKRPFVPNRFFDASVLKSANVTSAGGLYGKTYVSGFEKLWGVKSK